MSVSVKNVKRMFGQQAALNGVSLDVPSPKCWASLVQMGRVSPR